MAFLDANTVLRASNTALTAECDQLRDQRRQTDPTPGQVWSADHPTGSERESSALDHGYHSVSAGSGTK
ncbi:hypothetical protein GCM10027262_53610 [Nocardia tengchongensis]